MIWLHREPELWASCSNFQQSAVRTAEVLTVCWATVQSPAGKRQRYPAQLSPNSTSSIRCGFVVQQVEVMEFGFITHPRSRHSFPLLDRVKHKTTELD